MKLTKARRAALEWFRDNDGGQFWPAGVSKRAISSLVSDGLLREECQDFSFVKHFITPAGREALKGGGE